jgi:hypothetical protein
MHHIIIRTTPAAKKCIISLSNIDAHILVDKGLSFDKTGYHTQAL